MRVLIWPAFKHIHLSSNWHGIVTQTSAPGSATLWGSIPVVLWTALLSLGLWGLFSLRQQLKLRIFVGLVLLGQLALHLLYGDETFLYALHFAPLLVVLAALSTLTRARPLALILAGALVLSMGTNNGLQFGKATDFLQSHTLPKYQGNALEQYKVQ